MGKERSAQFRNEIEAYDVFVRTREGTTCLRVRIPTLKWILELEVCGEEKGPILYFSEQENGLPVAVKCGTFRE